MRFLMVLIGVLTALIGLLPFLERWGMMPGFLAGLPTSGAGYQLIVVIIGLVIILYGLRASRNIAQLMGR